MKKILCLIFLFVSLAFGDAAPFGFEINKATYDEVVSKYPIWGGVGTSEITGGKSMGVKTKHIKIDSLECCTILFTFDKQDKLVAVNFVKFNIFTTNQCEDLRKSLNKKYKVVKKDKDGNFEFKDGNSIINLKMDICTLNYESISYRSAYKAYYDKKWKAEEDARRKKEKEEEEERLKKYKTL